MKWVYTNNCVVITINYLPLRHVNSVTCHWVSSYQERTETGIPLTGVTPPHVCACPKPGPGFPMSYVLVFFFVHSELR